MFFFLNKANAAPVLRSENQFADFIGKEGKMKFASTITLLAAIALAFQPAAKADDEGAALIGGLIGGIIIGSILDDDRSHHHVSYSSRRHYSNHHSSGYYKWVNVKVWVPGRYVYSCDAYGNSYRTWRRGHYSYNKRKVWVPYRRHGRVDHCYEDSHHYGPKRGGHHGYYREKSDYVRY